MYGAPFSDEQEVEASKDVDGYNEGKEDVKGKAGKVEKGVEEGSEVCLQSSA